MFRYRAVRWLVIPALGLSLIGCQPGAQPSAASQPAAHSAVDIPVVYAPSTTAEPWPEVVAPVPVDPPTTTTTTPTTTTTAPPPAPAPAPPPDPAPRVRIQVAETHPPAPAVELDRATASQFVALTNGVRGAAGLDPLTRTASLDSAAAGWARELAASGNLRHSSIPRSILGTPWTAAGENVGFGPSVTTVHEALVASAGHYANMVGAKFTSIGIGAARDSNGQVWVVEIFAG